jgi:hypothetical protein
MGLVFHQMAFGELLQVHALVTERGQILVPQGENTVEKCLGIQVVLCCFSVLTKTDICQILCLAFLWGRYIIICRK